MGVRVFHTTKERWGSVQVVASERRLTKDGRDYIVDPLYLKLFPAWAADPHDPTFDVGPEVIDLDKMDAGNLAALRKFWGAEWEAKLFEWLTEGEGKVMFGFVPGDPRPKRRVKVVLTADELEALRVMREKSGGEPLPDASMPTGAQAVVSGGRSAGGRVR